MLVGSNTVSKFGRNICTRFLTLNSNLECIKRVSYPGTRLLVLNDIENGNALSSKANKELTNYLTSCEKSESVSVVFFSSGSDEIFSDGVSDSDYLANSQNASLFKFLQINANNIKRFKKPTVAAFMGRSTGTSFGAFGASMVSYLMISVAYCLLIIFVV